MVLLSSPNNPTGRVFTREELTELSQFIIKHDLICVCLLYTSLVQGSD